MPRKREVLLALKRDELVAAADRFDLFVQDRRVRDDLIDALASSRKAGFAEILENLPRLRLKEICRALNLDDSGREKAARRPRSSHDADGPERRGSRLDSRGASPYL